MKHPTVQTSEAHSVLGNSRVGSAGHVDLTGPTSIRAAGHEGHEGHVMPPVSKPPAVKPGKDKPAVPRTPPASKPKEKKAGNCLLTERRRRGIRRARTTGAWRRPASPRDLIERSSKCAAKRRGIASMETFKETR